MILTSLTLHGFKNYRQAQFIFIKGINCVLGRNGLGKTNLLDSIHYLSLAKTSLYTSDTQNILSGKSQFSIHGSFDDDLVVACGYELRKGKTLKVNGKEKNKLSEHVGTVPLVMVSPDDNEMIREGSEFRRKFFDGAISQVDPEYLSKLIRFNKLLKQRNEHLKSSAENGAVDNKLLDTYDDQLIPLSKFLSESREHYIKEFKKYFGAAYASLHDYQESPDIDFQSEVLGPSFSEKFRASRPRDILVGRTTLGAHRDKYEFKLDENQIKKFGSQGQQKTFIIALKLAEFDFLQAKLKKCPILLLDDIFDKLDDSRIRALVKLLTQDGRFQQVFVTDAREERSKEFFNGIEVNFYRIAIMGEDSTQSFKDAFGKFLKEEHLDETFKRKQLIDSWERIMGRPISARTTKMFFKNRTLYVELSSASLKDELNRSKNVMIARIIEHMGEQILDDIKFI